MFIFENPHPELKRVGDCVKRACVLASGINYHDITIMLNRFRKEAGAKKFNSDYNWRYFIEKVLLGCDLGNMQYANKGHRFTIAEFSRQRKSKAIVQASKHIVFVNGKGDYLDTWDSGYKSIYKAWGIPSYEIIVAHIKANYKQLCKGLDLKRYHYENN